ncbi:hypothetical protein KFK09_006430 [Dendrobium nobile]|uniref:Uncharacterized protein n=1 Tax=Dendrobium nobile TaxID=94219 RepID=A0A8T3BTM6_DENNO|nr:hypothetical protein KFK09_006430 [Dendrobium nobile]
MNEQTPPSPIHSQNHSPSPTAVRENPKPLIASVTRSLQENRTFSLVHPPPSMRICTKPSLQSSLLQA